jgi:hypothetical protein
VGRYYLLVSSKLDAVPVCSRSDLPLTRLGIIFLKNDAANEIHSLSVFAFARLLMNCSALRLTGGRKRRCRRRTKQIARLLLLQR